MIYRRGLIIEPVIMDDLWYQTWLYQLMMYGIRRDYIRHIIPGITEISMINWQNIINICNINTYIIESMPCVVANTSNYDIIFAIWYVSAKPFCFIYASQCHKINPLRSLWNQSLVSRYFTDSRSRQVMWISNLEGFSCKLKCICLTNTFESSIAQLMYICRHKILNHARKRGIFFKMGINCGSMCNGTEGTMGIRKGSSSHQIA